MADLQAGDHVTAPALVEDLSVRLCTFPTGASASDGTLEWESTTLVIVELGSGCMSSLG